ncbi:aminoglycoside 6'-N-acetyltransferase [Rummeliibacillus sp. NPDC094406]|uniref:aminoglycoside 6'-N-acetyltransferase n=1 Tax=Rummeliibacillus sp. NPDC094406 TaxID=3364511 RepID=UPI00380151BF
MLKQATLKEATIAAELALLLWPNHSIEEFTHDMQRYISSEDVAIFLAYYKDEAIGFAQCQLRSDYVEGTESNPVGYLEGLFVKESFRQQGYARLLVTHCEHWAKQKGCMEFASDCELHNEESLAMHLKLGFTEANRIICFTKKL